MIKCRCHLEKERKLVQLQVVDGRSTQDEYASALCGALKLDIDSGTGHVLCCVVDQDSFQESSHNNNAITFAATWECQ